MASTASLDKMATNNAATPTNEMSTYPPIQTPTQMSTSTHPLDDGLLNFTLPSPIDTEGI